MVKKKKKKIINKKKHFFSYIYIPFLIYEVCKMAFNECYDK